MVAPGENTTTGYTYDAADQLTQEQITGSRSNTRTFDYDLEGNQTRAGNDTYTYALDHTMTSATTGGKTTNYTWDATGNRIGAVTGTGAAQVVQKWNWDVNAGSPVLASETQTGAGGDVERSYLYGPGGEPLALLGSGAHSYLHDWLGGVSGLVSPTGGQEWAYDYDAFGVDRGTDKLSADAPANPLQYAGTYHDTSQGDRYAMGARNYDPGTGRFDATDPVAQPATDSAVSSYSYTNARPTALTDPTGQDPIPGGTPYFGGSLTNPQTPLNNPEAGTETVVANNPDGTQTVEVDNPEWQSSKKLVDEAGSFVARIGDEIVNLILDLVGFNDAKKCVTEGDIVACISTALQAVPWGKVFKAAKVAIKAIGVGRRLVEAYSKLRAAKAALLNIPQRLTKIVGAKAATKVESAAARQVDDSVAAAKDIGGAAKKKAEKAASGAKKQADDATSESCTVAGGAEARMLSNSFVAGTAVVMGDGSSKRIEKIQPGDTVKATDPDTGVSKPEQVTASIVGKGKKDLIDLTLVGAGSGGGGPPAKITATAGHKFYSPGKGWIPATNLQPGDKLRDTDGNTVTVRKAAEHTAQTTVYNLTVNNTHTYYVKSADTTVLVHNCGTAKDLARRASEIHAKAGSDIAMEKSTVAVVSAQTPKGVVHVVAGSGK